MIELRRRPNEMPSTERRIHELFAQHEKAQDARFSRLAERLQKQRDYTTVFTTDLANVIPNASGGMLFLEGLHLAEGSPIGSVIVAHYGATATIMLYEGPAGMGRILGAIKPGKMFCAALSDNVAQVSLRSSGADTGLVVVTLTSKTHKPSCSSLT